MILELEDGVWYQIEIASTAEKREAKKNPHVPFQPSLPSVGIHRRVAM